MGGTGGGAGGAEVGIEVGGGVGERGGEHGGEVGLRRQSGGGLGAVLEILLNLIGEAHAFPGVVVDGEPVVIPEEAAEQRQGGFGGGFLGGSGVGVHEDGVENGGFRGRAEAELIVAEVSVEVVVAGGEGLGDPLGELEAGVEGGLDGGGGVALPHVEDGSAPGGGFGGGQEVVRSEERRVG